MKLFVNISLTLVIICVAFFYGSNLLLSNTNKIFGNEDRIAFYVLGGSTSFGEPYDDEPSFIRLITKKLKGKFQNKPIDVVMIAGSGKTLIQNYLDLTKESIIRPYKESYTFIYTGINEFDTTPFNKHQFKFEQLMLKYPLTTMLYSFILPPDVSKMPNSIEFFNERLKATLKLTSKTSNKTFISTIAGNYHEFPPEISKIYSDHEYMKLISCEKYNVMADIVSCLNRYDLNPEYKEYYSLLLEYKDSKDIKILTNIIHRWSHFSSNRPSPSKNEIISSVSSIYDNVYLVDSYGSLERYENGFLGYNLFADAHHPNIDGMLILTNSFLNKFLKEDQFITSEDIQRWYGDKIDKKSVLLSRLRWLFFYSLIEKYPFLRARAILNKANENKSLFSDEELNVLFTIVKILSPKSSFDFQLVPITQDGKDFLYQYFLHSDFTKRKFKKIIEHHQNLKLLDQKTLTF